MKNIAIFKNKDKKEGSKQPDYRLVASWKKEDGTYGSVTVGSLWKGEGENAPILRGEMKDAYTNQEGKEYPAFEIKRVEGKTDPVAEAQDLTPEDIPF